MQDWNDDSGRIQFPKPDVVLTSRPLEVYQNWKIKRLPVRVLVIISLLDNSRFHKAIFDNDQMFVLF